MNAPLSAAATDLLETLTRRIRLISLGQLKRLWSISNRNRRTFERRLSRLCAAGWLEVHTINVHVLSPAAPLFLWQPGGEEPDANTLARESQDRWNFPTAPTTVCVASRRTANLFGSTSIGLPKLEHRDHDLLLASVFVIYRLQRPQLASSWIGEHARPKAGYQVKDPDAFLMNGEGRVLRVIESGGRYRPSQIESFHEYCAGEQLSYELW